MGVADGFPGVAARVLVGHGTLGAEARVRIGEGQLAGAEVRLLHGAGGIEASLLTRTESSRQTLVVAMDEVARRLQSRGVMLRVQRPTDTSRTSLQATDRWSAPPDGEDDADHSTSGRRGSR